MSTKKTKSLTKYQKYIKWLESLHRKLLKGKVTPEEVVILMTEKPPPPPDPPG